MHWTPKVLPELAQSGIWVIQLRIASYRCQTQPEPARGSCATPWHPQEDPSSYFRICFQLHVVPPGFAAHTVSQSIHYGRICSQLHCCCPTARANKYSTVNSSYKSSGLPSWYLNLGNYSSRIHLEKPSSLHALQLSSPTLWLSD